MSKFQKKYIIDFDDIKQEKGYDVYKAIQEPDYYYSNGSFVSPFMVPDEVAELITETEGYDEIGNLDDILIRLSW